MKGRRGSDSGSCRTFVSAFLLAIIGMCLGAVVYLLLAPPPVSYNAVSTAFLDREKLAAREQAAAYTNWQTRVPNKYARDLHTPCFHPIADPLLGSALARIDAVLGLDNRVTNATREVELALEDLIRACTAHPACPITTQLLMAVTFFLGRDGDAVRLAEQARQAFPLHGKIQLWAGLIFEATSHPGAEGVASPQALYAHAVLLSPEIALDYFGLAPHLISAKVSAGALTFFTHRSSVVSTPKARGYPIALRTLRKLLLARELGPYFGGNPAMDRRDTSQWATNLFAHVKGVVDPYSLAAVRDAYRDWIALGVLTFKDPQAVRYISYNDPVARFVHASSTGIIARLTDFPVKPTYTYFGGYVGSKGSDLKPHTDRPACEFTATLHIDVNPLDQFCPLGVNPIPNNRSALEKVQGSINDAGRDTAAVYVFPRPGDALVFKGRHLVHWRPPIAVDTNCSNIFLHYVHESFDGSLD